MSRTLTPESGNVAIFDPPATSARHLRCPTTLHEVGNDAERSCCLVTSRSAIMTIRLQISLNTQGSYMKSTLVGQ
jgi:hypothetical protein